MSVPFGRETTPPRTVHNSAPPFPVPGHKAGQSPHARGSAVRGRHDDARIDPISYVRDDYLGHLKVDLRNNRILMDIDTFSERVLRIPFPPARSAQFKTMDPEFNALVETIFKDKIFRDHLQLYVDKCMQPGGIEKQLYPIYCDMSNRALKLSEKKENEDSIRLHVNDPKHIGGGIMNKGLSPDIIAALRALLESSLQRIGAKKEEFQWFWHMIPFLVEGKDRDCDVWDARDGFRMLNAETQLDPITITAEVPIGRRPPQPESRLVNPNAGTHSESVPVAQKKKRKAVGLPEIPESPSKKARSQPGLVRRTKAASATKIGGNVRTTKTHEQLATYGLEALSIPGLRDSFVLHLFDRDRIQLLYVSHSLIVTSTAVDLTDPDGVKRLIAILIGHNRLSLRQHGVLSVVDEAESFLRNYDFNASRGRDSVTRKDTYSGLTMTLPIEGESRDIKVTLGSLIAQEPGIIGRTTGVFEGTSEEWPDRKLVIKLSWPNKNRTSEATYLRAAQAAAEKDAQDGQRHWVHDHLPGLLYSHDFATESDSTEARLGELLKDAVFADEKEFAYEQRLLRVTVQELLYPLESLTSARDVAQVFADVVQCHAWLYDCPQILHRDISMSNIMYRVKEDGRICGVLNDFDLASFLWELADDVTSTSLQRTGTPPFMAIDLLVDADQSAPKHLYRHDLESFFHVMAVFTSRYHLQVPEVPRASKKTSPPPPPPHVELRTDVQPLPFESWFESTDFVHLRRIKKEFILDEESPDIKKPMSDYVSPSFHGLVPWLNSIRLMFRIGMTARNNYRVEEEVREARAMKEKARSSKAGRGPRRVAIPPLEPFDDATLGGKVSYELFMADVADMTFDVAVDIRYE